MGTPQTFPMASVPTQLIDGGVVQVLWIWTCTAHRPTSTRLEPVMDLRGFDHWFLLSYTFPPCLPDPSRLAVPTRPVVVRAAPAFPSVSWVRLPSASADRYDGPQEGILSSPHGQTAPRGALLVSSTRPCSRVPRALRA